MSLLRRAGRVAVASSIHGNVQQRQRARWAAQSAQQTGVPEQATAPAPTTAATSTQVDPAQRIALLKDLAELHAAGVLTDAEFSAQKAALLS
ncbi:MAG: SHOCT domain-containing protein [Propionibacterium sp.]